MSAQEAKLRLREWSVCGNEVLIQHTALVSGDERRVERAIRAYVRALEEPASAASDITEAVERLTYMSTAPEEGWIAGPQSAALAGVIVRRADLCTLLTERDTLAAEVERLKRLEALWTLQTAALVRRKEAAEAQSLRRLRRIEELALQITETEARAEELTRTLRDALRARLEAAEGALAEIVDNSLEPFAAGVASAYFAPSQHGEEGHG